MIPIAVRTRNRPVYCDVTLKSLMATDLPPGARPVVIDDRSDDPLAIRYVSTDDTIRPPRGFRWPETTKWQQMVGRISNPKVIRGIKSKFEVVTPDSSKGERGGAFWSVCFLFEHFPEAELAILLEGDIVLNKGWHAAAISAWESLKDKPGPNGRRLGLLSVYDRRGGFPKSLGPRTCGFRSIIPIGGGRWGCGDGISGQMYLIPRSFYDENRERLKAPCSPESRGGDTWLQGMCGEGRWNIAVTVPSYCQHVGVDSLAWPAKGWRHTTNFQKPFAFEKFDNGVATSDEWQ